jgi:uridine phosphorylase
MSTIPASELILNADGSIYHLGLLPAQLADIVLTVGDPDRVSRISKYFDEIEVEIKRREFVIHTGTYKGKRLTVLSTGMGTDNIDIVMNELDAVANIDLKNRRVKEEFRKLTIIRVGTSGALQPDVPVGSHLASAAVFGLDALMQSYRLPQQEREAAYCQDLKKHMNLNFMPYFAPVSNSLLMHFGAGMFPGVTATCAGFYGPQGRVLRLKPANENFVHDLSSFRSGGIRITNFEMETAGYYALASLLGHEAISLNAIVANRISQEFATNADQVVENLITEVLEKTLTYTSK